MSPQAHKAGSPTGLEPQVVPQHLAIVVRHLMLLVLCRPARHSALEELIFGWPVHTNALRDESLSDKVRLANSPCWAHTAVNEPGGDRGAASEGELNSHGALLVDG